MIDCMFKRLMLIKAIVIGATLLATGVAMAGSPRALFPNAKVVRVYIYKPEHAVGGIYGDDFLALNKSAAPRHGIRLSRRQTAQLRQAILDAAQSPGIERGNCFKPRHAFVFQDARGRPIGVADVDFECHHVGYNAPGYIRRSYEVIGRLDEGDARPELDAIDREFHIPSRDDPVDWGALEALVRDLGLPTKPTPEDYTRLSR